MSHSQCEHCAQGLVTPRTRARSSVMLSPELVSSALQSAPDAIVIVDASGDIVFSNQQVSALFGYSPEDLAGQRVECLLPERFRARHVATP